MKQLKLNFTLLLILGIYHNAFAQFTKLNIEQTTVSTEENIQKYDSLESINIENAKLHIGQTIYLKENKSAQEKGVYQLLYIYTKPIFEFSTTHLYKSKLNNDGYNSCDYEQLKGCLFYVNRIIKNEKEENYWNRNKSCLELIETKRNDTVYLYFSDLDNHFRNFITVGYYEKLKQLFKGKEFVFLDNRKPGTIYSEEGGLYDITNGEDRKDIPKGTKLKCIDIQIENGGDNDILAILENSTHGKSFVLLNSIMRTGIANNGKLETIDEYNNRIARNNTLIKKYGTQNANLIINGQVKIGFTKQMCIDSWGKPEEINKTTGNYGVHEQWVYSNENYLYFENGILKTIQN